MAVQGASHRSISAEPAAVIELLVRWLSGRLAPAALDWLSAEIDRQRTAVDERRLAIALGLVGRKVGRTDLLLTADEAAAAGRLRADWQPQIWGTDEAARIAILLATSRGDDRAFATRVDRLCTTAEVTEYVACLRGFAVFPAGPQLHDRAREGVRSSIAPVFAAIACHNPYPFDHFDETAWNQMVVKCVFSGAPIGSIVGVWQRRNRDLLHMLGDLIAERNAAGRALPDAVHAYVAGKGVSHAPMSSAAKMGDRAQ
jgi:hypothetical protein